METQFNHNSDILVVEYYQDAYGPTIHMDSQSMRTVLATREIFLGLAHHAVEQVQLHELAWVRMINIKAFVLTRVPDGKEGLRTLRRGRGSAAELLFAWSRDSEGWLECAEKLDRLVEKQTPGHQYLNLEGTDDALVEFSYREKAN